MGNCGKNSPKRLTGRGGNRLVSVPVRRIQRYVLPERVPVLESACRELPEGSVDHNTALSALAELAPLVQPGVGILASYGCLLTSTCRVAAS
jgi:hypothetical protein